VQPENILHNYNLPIVHSILIIDDKIKYIKEKYEANKFFFEACIESQVSPHPVVVDIKNSIDSGFKSWINGSYDLVLIDYDFKDIRPEHPPDTKSTPDSVLLSCIFPERQGLELFRLIFQLLKTPRFSYRKAYQKIYLWTSHRLKKGVEDDLKDDELNYYKEKRSYHLSDLSRDLTALKELFKGEVNDNQEEYDSYIAERVVYLSLINNNLFNINGYIGYKRDYNKRSLYKPLLNGSRLYLLPFRPPDDDFYWCSIEQLHNEVKINQRLSGRDLFTFIKDNSIKPRIRSSISLDKDIYEYRKNSNKIYENLRDNAKKLKFVTSKTKFEFAGVEFKSDLWLAATPLTMVTIPGDDDDIFNLLKTKLDTFFDIGFGAAVLKTTYIEANDDNIEWSKDHAQRHHRTRVYTSRIKGQLWNTGKTALEAFPPKMLNNFLKYIIREKPEWKNEIIVSLGSKTIKKEEEDHINLKLWREKLRDLFEIVFSDLNVKSFPLVEFNVRHFLRPLLNMYLDGDEYSSPIIRFIEKDGGFNWDNVANYHRMFSDFRKLLIILDQTGRKYQKKIILKFPYRSDIISFLMSAQEINKEVRNVNGADNDNYGISGVTLINTYKSPYPHSIKDVPYAEGDEIKMPQMSGIFLAWIRNYLLFKLKEIKGFTLPISVSGGVGTTTDDIHYLRKQFGDNGNVKSIQFGTSILTNITDFLIVPKKKNTDKDKGSPFTLLNINKDSKLSSRIIYLHKYKCRTCGKCYNSFYCDAFLNRGTKNELPLIDVTACTGCGLCVQNCKHGALELKPSEDCVVLCCPFSESRSLILREKGIPHIPLEVKDSVFIDNYILEKDLKVLEKATNAEKNSEIAAIARAKKAFDICIRKVRKPEINPLASAQYLGVKTSVFGKNQTSSKFVKLNVPMNKDEVKNNLLQFRSFIAITGYAIKNGKEPNEKIISGYVLTDEFVLSLNQEEIASYCKSNVGVGKSGGIDILGHGGLLFHGIGKRLEDIYAFAGIPTEAIAQLSKIIRIIE